MSEVLRLRQRTKLADLVLSSGPSVTCWVNFGHILSLFGLGRVGKVHLICFIRDAAQWRLVYFYIVSFFLITKFHKND